MPWKNLSEEEERRNFAIVAKNGKINFAALCRAHGITRRTGYKWRKRYEGDPKHGLEPRSRRPVQPCSWAAKWRRRLLAWRQRRPTWGGRLLHSKLRRQWPRTRCPAVRTLEHWLTAAGVTRRGKRRGPTGPVVPRPGHLRAKRANDVWTLDFKGPLTIGGRTIEPLTVFDLACRYGLAVCVVAAKDYTCTRRVILELFARHGLPRAIQVDNGPPFGGNGARGLSRLSAEWTRCGIHVQFSRPACPQDNPEHERWHHTLQDDLRRFPFRAGETLAQRIERLLKIYNSDRTHRSLRDRLPAALYHRSPRHYREVPPRHYPAKWPTVTPNSTGRAWYAGRQRAFGRAFFGQRLGLCPVEPGQWEVYLDHLLLGLIVATDCGGLRPVMLGSSLPPSSPPHSPPTTQGGEGFALPCTPPAT